MASGDDSEVRLPANEALRERWFAAWRGIGCAEAPAAALSGLLQAYGAPDRYYHGRAHLVDCLAKLDKVRDLAEHPAEVELALWFHDAVYDTHAADNEARSADLAVETMGRAGAAAPVIERVRGLILATRHDAMPESADGRLIADIDLSILGAEEAAFRAYEAAIRREYAWVPEATFRERRAAILAGFLRRERIYHTTPFHARCEEPARRNLLTSISALIGGTAAPE